MYSNKETGKFKVSRLDGLTEKLASLLAASQSSESALMSAEKLVSEYGKLATVMAENEDSLCDVADFGINQAILIKLAAYINSRRITDEYRAGVIYTEPELITYMIALFLGSSVETVYAVMLDKNGALLNTECMGEGTVVASDVYPRRLLESAIRHKASKIILAHNHPKGTASPSSEDVSTTKQLEKILLSSDIELIGHYVVADGDIEKVQYK